MELFEIVERPNKYDFDFSEDYESNLETYCDELEKALDKACKLIIEAVSQDCTIFDEVIEDEYMWRTEIHEWTEWCMKDE